MESETERKKPLAVFMAFGTKGDVFPIAAIAAGFACDQKQYNVIFITHSAHENLCSHLAEKHVAYFQISSPPILSIDQIQNATDSSELSFSLQKRMLTRDCRQECYSITEKIFGCGPSMEGWSLAEFYHVRCIVAAPYVVPYSAPSAFERQFKRDLLLLYKYLRESPTKQVILGF